VQRRPGLLQIAHIIGNITKSPDHDIFREGAEIGIAAAEKSDGPGVRRIA
jgi:hypothetical protein